MIDPSSDDISDAPFLAMVRRYSNDKGAVDYARWHASVEDRRVLATYLEHISRISPENRPDLFHTQGEELAYWISVYNALVIARVLALWPVRSVRDVKGSLSSYLVPGKGFFYDGEVVVGGRHTNLHHLEVEIILRRVRDPRIHFALNCASAGCPVLRPIHFDEEQLERAAREFIGDDRNVRVDERGIWLSTIFRWYDDDFVGWLRTHGQPAGTIVDYIASHAPEPLRAQLLAAQADRRPIRFIDYDWALNGA